MQEHLDQGCGSCLKMVRTWATMVDFARHEPFYEPPDGAVRNAGSYFFSFSLTLRKEKMSGYLRHVFDSFDLGILDGIRGSGTAPRQLLYNSYSVFIDLHLEQKPGSDSDRSYGASGGCASQRTEYSKKSRSCSLVRGMWSLKPLRIGLVNLISHSLRLGHLGLLLSMNEVGLLLLLPEGLAGNSRG